jgi:tetratricopeptide (TPR) repeat protein
MTRLAATLVNRMRKLRVSPEREPQLARLRTDSLEELRKGMLELAREMDEKGVSTFGGPATYQALGDLMMSLGQGEEALRLYRQAFDLLRKIADDPDARAEVHDVGQGNLGMMHLSMGDAILGLTGDARTALDLFRQARDLHQDLVAHARSRKYSELDKKRFLSHDNWFLAKAYLALGDPVAARDHLRQCLAYRQEWVAAQPRNPVAQGFLVQAHMGAGHVAGHLGDAAGVREHFGAAVRLMEDLGRRSPDSFDFKHDLADVYGAYGDAQMRLGLGDEAEKSYRRAFDNITAVAKHAPDDPAPLPLLALTHERLAALARSRGNAADAARHAEEACRLRRELAELEPNNLVRQAGYVLALARCGRPAEALPRADKLRPRVAGSPELLLQLARCYAAGGQQGREKALEAVRTATAKDYRDAAVLETDPELAELRGEPAFRDVVAAVKKRS